MEHFRNITDWIREDWRENRFRFILEVLCWLDSMACAIIVNTTVPDLPFTLLYPLWISGTLAYAWCAYSRQSFGMVITFIMLAAIDSAGFMRLLLSQS